MGLFGESRRRHIARPDNDEDALFFLWPKRAIRTLSELHVGADEVALLCRDGKPYAKFLTGRYLLDAAEYPILGDFLDVDNAGGFFRAELLFVRTGTAAEQKFSLMFNDNGRDEHYADLVVAGGYRLAVSDIEKSVRFLQQLPQAGPDALADWTTAQIRRAIRNVIAAKHQGELSVQALHDGALRQFESDILAEINRDIRLFGFEVRALDGITLSSRPAFAGQPTEGCINSGDDSAAVTVVEEYDDEELRAFEAAQEEYLRHQLFEPAGRLPESAAVVVNEPALMSPSLHHAWS